MPDIQVNGTRISYRDAGQGAPIVLLHCSSSHSGQWKPWFPHLEALGHVIAPDFHGYGRSEPLPDGVAWWQADVEIVPQIAALTGQKLHLVGHSLGGAAAVYAAKKHPDCVASVTAIEPVLFGLLEQQGLPEFEDAKMISTRLWTLLEGGADVEAAREFTDFWSGPGTFERLAPHQSAYVIQTIERVGDDWRGLASDLVGQLTLDDIDTLGRPVHLIKGDRSRPSGQRIVELLSDRLPRSDLTVIPDADHLGAVTRPEKFIQAITAWLTPRIAA